jgi:hypothetical protein
VHALGLPGELRAQQLELACVDGHDEGIAGAERLPDERQHAAEELVVARVEERLVPEGLLCGRGAHTAADRCEPTTEAWSCAPPPASSTTRSAVFAPWGEGNTRTQGSRGPMKSAVLRHVAKGRAP